MVYSSQRLPVSWNCVFFALLGAAYCGLLASPMESVVPCPGSGCRMFRSFTLYGVSLWWVGTAYFVLMLLVLLRRMTGFALGLAGLALVCDAGLLLILCATVPCVSCLGAAAFIGVLFVLVRGHAYSMAMLRPRPSLLFLFWAALFLAAVLAAALEHVPAWSLSGRDHAERRLYFSPSCPACRDAIAVFGSSAVAIPIAEKESDYAAIYRMQEALAKGDTVPSALAKAESGNVPAPYTPEMLLLRARLVYNKAQVMRLGFDSLPLIMINGMPQSLRPENTGAQSGSAASSARHAQGSTQGLPPELLDRVDSCGGSQQEPCDPPRESAPRY